MNSAVVVNDAPEVLMDQDTHYRQWMHENTSLTDSQIGHYGDFNYKVAKFFGDDPRNRYDAGKYYETYLENANNRNEAKAVQSARAYDEFMSNTAYSRAFADLERSGVNPYLLLNSGATPSTSTGSSSKASYSRPSTKESVNNHKARDFALVLLAISRIAALL